VGRSLHDPVSDRTLEGSVGQPAIWVWNGATTIERTSGFHHRYRGQGSDANQPGLVLLWVLEASIHRHPSERARQKRRISDVRFIQDSASLRRDPLSMLTLLVAADDAGWGDRDFAIPRTCSRILRGETDER
jgi:hypothetical protein